MEALQYLKEKYEKEGNAIYFREPDLPMSTSLERICKYMREYAESHTAAHTAALRENIATLRHQRDFYRKKLNESKRTHIAKDLGIPENIEMAPIVQSSADALRERVKELEAENTRLRDSLEKAINVVHSLSEPIQELIDILEDAYYE